MYEIPNVLEKSEKVMWEGKPKYSAYMFSSLIFVIIILAILLWFLRSFTFVLIAVFLLTLFIILTHLSYKVKHYAITNKRIVIQSGIIGRDFKFVDYDKMQNVSVDVGLIDKIFSTGTIKVFSGEIGSTYVASSSSNRSDRGTYAPTPVYDSFTYILTPYDVVAILQNNLSKRKEASIDVLKSIEGILKKKSK